MEVKSAFILTSNIIRANARRNKMLALLRRNATGTTRGGLLGLKMEFINKSPVQIKRVICYGQLTQSSQIIMRKFEGKNPHV